jgi:hypothetical protein
MRRLALLAAAVLAVAAAPAARAEPLDIDLSRLGAPDPAVWGSIYSARGVTPAAGELDALVKGSRQRFAILSAETALAISSAILHPASTTGHTGFAVDLEVATLAVHSDPVGATTAGYAATPWAGAHTQPSSLYLPSVHVRKGLPFSFEVGGRFIYLAMSNAFAGQGEAKWAINEGFEYVPDFAVRAAYTRLFGVKDWNLSTTDVDFMLSKRFGMMGVTSLTPYLAARFTWINASTERIEFSPGTYATTGVVDSVATQASFPNLSLLVYRTTAGLRFTAYSVSMALEGTYFAGATASKAYEGTKIKSSFGGAAKLGWEW